MLRLSAGSRRLSGREFQVDGPATAKHRQPNFKHVFLLLISTNCHNGKHSISFYLSCAALTIDIAKYIEMKLRVISVITLEVL